MVAGDEPAAKQKVMALVEELGFDAVDDGSLHESWRQQPGTPAYCTNLLLQWLRTLSSTHHLNPSIVFAHRYSFYIFVGLYESAIGLRLRRNILAQFEAQIYRVILHRDLVEDEMLALEDLFAKFHPDSEICTVGLDLLHEILVSRLAEYLRTYYVEYCTSNCKYSNDNNRCLVLAYISE